MINQETLHKLDQAIKALDAEDRKTISGELGDIVKGWNHDEPDVGWFANERIGAVYQSFLELLQ